ncbi:FAD-dependent oxidoreductase [Candidatus Woesearchaeota archaeon]|nr:FAD-dependent oxidoreductase [Candidatus Woesearchaeota archaeon]
MTTKNDYDVVIIGGGAAGMTAAIYTCRKKMKTAVITYDVGGQTNLTNHIENYSGTIKSTGVGLMMKFQEHAQKFGAEFIPGKVEKVTKKGERFTTTLTNGKLYTSTTIILAFGKVPRALGVPGEDKFLGRGVSTCATCDAPLYKGKIVAVVGGGNSAIEAAEELSHNAKMVYIIHRRESFRGDAITIEKLKLKNNIKFLLNSTVEEISGKDFVEKIMIKNVNNSETQEISVEGVFVEIGYIVDTSMVKDLVKVNEKNEIIVDEYNKTNTPGLFAAGDVTTIPYKQTVISAGEGAKAALTCYQYFTGGKGVTIDWDH